MTRNELITLLNKQPQLFNGPQERELTKLVNDMLRSGLGHFMMHGTTDAGQDFTIFGKATKRPGLPTRTTGFIGPRLIGARIPGFTADPSDFELEVADQDGHYLIEYDLIEKGTLDHYDEDAARLPIPEELPTFRLRGVNRYDEGSDEWNQIQIDTALMIEKIEEYLQESAWNKTDDRNFYHFPEGDEA